MQDIQKVVKIFIGDIMKFKANTMGNRVFLKTIKNGETTKITPLTFENAESTINNIIINGWTIEDKR